MDFKELVKDAMVQAKMDQDGYGEICRLKSFFGFRWSTTHNWSIWVREGRVTEMTEFGPSVTALVMMRKCLTCGEEQTKTIKYGT